MILNCVLVLIPMVASALAFLREIRRDERFEADRLEFRS